MLCAFSKKGVMDKKCADGFFVCLSLPITVKDKALNYEPVEALFMSTNLFSAGLLFTYDIGGNLVTVGPHI